MRRYLTGQEIAELDRLLTSDVWYPLSGPQTQAFYSQADELFYGGAAGGGKSDLLLGLALTRHQRSVIFRREATQLQGLLDRLHIEILKNRDGYNGKERIQRLPDGRQLEFGSCPNLGDEQRYQGRPHDLLCVEIGTPILMDDGSYLPIERVKTGHKVMTLEGPRRVLRTFDKGFDTSVSVRAFSHKGVSFQQVQGSYHSVLTNEGWVSHDMLRGPHRSSDVLPGSTAPHDACNTLLSKRTLLREFLKPLLSKSLGRRRNQVFFQSFVHRFLREFSGYIFHRVSGSVSLGLSGKRQVFWRRVLSRLRIPVFVLPVPLSPHVLQAFVPAFGCGGACVGIRSSLQDSLGDYSTCFRPCGGRVPPGGVAGLFYLRPQADVEQHNPTYSEDDARGKAQKHIFRTESYVHPYTKEIRRARNSFSSSSLLFSPVGKRHLFDLSIDDTNHYISYNGFVNKNCFDEITHFMHSQYRFLCGWLRTTKQGQRCRIVAAGNPPTDSDGEWVIKHWGPWLDELNPNPAKPGELRWFAVIDGRDVEVSDGTPFEHGGEIITPRSRTFIPSKIQDNPYLMDTGYMSQLQALPEPLRSQMLNGDFMAGTGDDPWQVIPTNWVKIAQDRWTKSGKYGPMDSLGLDPSRGGLDTTNIARRHGVWFDEILQYPGQAVPDGPTCAALAITEVRDGAPIHVDIIGIGSSVYDHLKSNGIQVVGVNGAEASVEVDKSKKLRLRNVRAVCYWRLRELLDPKNNTGAALPPDSELRADLCAPRWKLTSSGILIESKEEIIKRIGRSPGKGDSVAYANMATPKKGAVDVNYKRLKAKYSRFGNMLRSID